MNSETLLLRQVHPAFVQANRITSQVFTPRASDQNRLSVYDGDQISAEQAWRHYTEEQHLMSAGVVGVTVANCLGEGLNAYPDPVDFPEHAVVDFGAIRKGRIKAIAKRLRVLAEQRDWLFREEQYS